MTKTHAIRDNTDGRSSDAQPHGLAASFVENARHGLDKMRARAFEHEDDAADELEPRTRHVAEVEVREEPSGVLHIGLDLNLKLKRRVENDQSVLEAEDDEDEEVDDGGLFAEDEDEPQLADEDSLLDADQDDEESLGAEGDELAAQGDEDDDLEAAADAEEPDLDENEHLEMADVDEDVEAAAEDDEEAELEAPIVTSDPRTKGRAAFTFTTNASRGARNAAAGPQRAAKALPWVSVRQVQWAAKHNPAAERSAKPGPSNPHGDVKLVQDALAKVLGVRSKDPAGIFEKDTQRLFHGFRTHTLKYPGIRPAAAPGAKGLTELGRRSNLFRVRTGLMPQVGGHAGSTPAKLSPHAVTFKRCTTPSTPNNISKWIRQACKLSGATPSNAWVRGYTTIIKRESGGNPNACNVWDSNAKTPPGFKKVRDFGDGYTRNGIIRLGGRPTPFQCSRGIVQCIPQTFAANHARGTSANIYDPVASIAASIRYVRGRYDVAKDGSNLARKVQQADPTRPPKGY